jgi:hypothetical protein
MLGLLDRPKIRDRPSNSHALTVEGPEKAEPKRPQNTALRRGSSLIPKADWAALVAAFLGEALVERTKIDHDSLVGSAADFFYAVACRHLEVDSLPFNVDYLGCRAHVATYRRGGEMSYIYRRADRALTSI